MGGLLLGGRGRLTSAVHRRKAIELISEAHSAGAGLVSACSEIGICLRTLKRWRKAFADDGDGHDRRKGSPRLVLHRLSEEVRSCQPWPIRGCISARRAASIGYFMPTAKPIGEVERGHHRNPGRFRGSVPQEPIRCGAGTSPISPPPCEGSGFTSTS
ncbi:MAG: helix-turn-helix domain-containing protein [Synechococcaceae bacterium WB9_4xB_025]|nr:helix-turn-helix domain-containing protein [Synechococcaceae bacterium WB9_4xB_025]